MRQMKTRYGQMSLYIILLFAVAVVMIGAKRCSSSAPLPFLSQGNSQGDTIDVAIVYGPLSYYLYNDTLGGLNYELLQKMEQDLRTPVKLWPVVSLHDALQRLEKGNYDMLASLPLDNSVKQRFLTSKSVFLDRLVLVQLADTSGKVIVNSALDLGPDSIHIQKDSPAAARLANLSSEIGTPIPVKQENGLSEEYLCMKVATGAFKLAVVNEKTAATMRATYPRLAYDNPVSFTQFQIWALPLGDTTRLATVDRWLDSIQQTPYYKNLIKRY